jgi:hypothetical protein
LSFSDQKSWVLAENLWFRPKISSFGRNIVGFARNIDGFGQKSLVLVGKSPFPPEKLGFRPKHRDFARKISNPSVDIETRPDFFGIARKISKSVPVENAAPRLR